MWEAISIPNRKAWNASSVFLPSWSFIESVSKSAFGPLGVGRVPWWIDPEAWYVSPAAVDGTSYFKSMDGHRPWWAQTFWIILKWTQTFYMILYDLMFFKCILRASKGPVSSVVILRLHKQTCASLGHHRKCAASPVDACDWLHDWLVLKLDCDSNWLIKSF